MHAHAIVPGKERFGCILLPHIRGRTENYKSKKPSIIILGLETEVQPIILSTAEALENYTPRIHWVSSSRPDFNEEGSLLVEIKRIIRLLKDKFNL